MTTFSTPVYPLFNNVNDDDIVVVTNQHPTGRCGKEVYDTTHLGEKCRTDGCGEQDHGQGCVTRGGGWGPGRGTPQALRRGMDLQQTLVRIRIHS